MTCLVTWQVEKIFVWIGFFCTFVSSHFPMHKQTNNPNRRAFAFILFYSLIGHASCSFESFPIFGSIVLHSNPLILITIQPCYIIPTISSILISRVNFSIETNHNHRYSFDLLSFVDIFIYLTSPVHIIIWFSKKCAYSRNRVILHRRFEPSLIFNISFMFPFNEFRWT